MIEGRKCKILPLPVSPLGLDFNNFLFIFSVHVYLNVFDAMLCFDCESVVGMVVRLLVLNTLLVVAGRL